MKNVFNVNPELIADSLRRKPIDHTGQRFFYVQHETVFSSIRE